MTGIVTTIRQRCRRCYSCVRECPAQAIKVINGQAVVIEERCIVCGHCVTVCSQNAKQVVNDKELVLKQILSSGKAVAIIAPSFPVSFPDHHEKLVGGLKEIGFSHVCETSFGADLVSQLYPKFIEANKDKTIISSPCPAVTNWIEKYYVDLIPNIATIVSPMIAMGRYLKQKLGENYSVVFIGPCIAKKSEYKDEEVAGDIDAVLTFVELHEIFEELRIDLNKCDEIPFDPPFANMGKTYPLTGGLLKSSELSNDILQNDILVVEGKKNVKKVIQEISNQKVKAKFVDILFCEGCINGPAAGSDLDNYSRKIKVVDYINEHINNVDKAVWKSEIYNSRDLDLTRSFDNKNQRRPMPSEEEIKKILAQTEKYLVTDELNCGSCGYPTCREYAIAIAKGLAEEDMCLPYLIEKLEDANRELKETQAQLHSAEKLASIGQLAAGVAHEINNPLGTIMLYASMMKRKMEKTNCSEQNSEDLQLIVEEATRCKNIVANLLNFARQGKIKLSTIKLNDLITNIVSAIKINPENSDIIINLHDNTEGAIIEGDSDQLKQVFLNVLNNSVEALDASSIKNITINIDQNEESIITNIIDTGVGIPEENINKLFTPFFTTKKMGKGTGLGLAITYGIVKMHKGDITVKTILGKGSDFKIKLPKILIKK
ncbi:MAG: ATP-binding protein [Melioribacteraceae bacterium]|nr:ATP-binding protein [Melioribacteraceae bacterium]